MADAAAAASCVLASGVLLLSFSAAVIRFPKFENDVFGPVICETRHLGIIIDKKLNFSCHVSRIAHNAHVRASLILRTFVSRDPEILTKAFIAYVRRLLECTPVWSPHTACNANKIESCQHWWFTKRIKGLYGLDYHQRLAFLGLESLQVRRIKYDLIMCYKILNGKVSLQRNFF